MIDAETNEPARRKTAGNITWNYIGHGVQLAVNFLLTSYIVRRLPVPEYGLFLFAISLSSTLYMLDLGISSVLVQAYVAASLSLEKNRLRELVSSVIVASAVLGAIGAAILLGLSFVLPGPFNVPREYLHEASLVFIASAGSILFGFLNLAIEPLYQAANRFDRVNQIQLAGSAVVFGCSAALLYLGYGITALAAVQFAAAAFQLFLSVTWFRSVVPAAQIRLHYFRWSTLKDLLSRSKWAFLNNISSYVLEIFVWTILGSLSSMRQAALFGLASKMPRHLWNLVDRGAGVCLPLMSEKALNDNLVGLRLIYLKAQRLVIGATLPFVVLGSVFARPLIEVWAGNQYETSALVMRWLLLAALGHAILYTSDLLLYAAGHYRRIAMISAAGGIMTLGIALIAVPRYGAAGMAFSMAITQVLFIGTLFTLEACKYANISLGLLASEMLRGVKLPTAIMIAGVCASLALWRYISSVWLVFFAVALFTSYFAVWGFRTALPLYREASEESS